MQDQQVRSRAGYDRIGTSFVVTELHEQGRLVKLFDDRANLPTRKPLLGKVREQCYGVQKGRPVALRAVRRCHHSTQHVTNLGASSPARTIQIVLTIALFRCRSMDISKRQEVPQASAANLRSFAGPRGFKQNISQPGCVAALEPKRVSEYSSLVSATRVRWLRQ
jgi:hypothetical protein